MAFDRNDPADLLALKTEVNTDPISMGYNINGGTVPLLNLLNLATNNVGGETAGRQFDVSAMLDALDPADYEAPQTNAKADGYVQHLISYGNIEAYKTKFRDLFAANSATVTALDAQTVALSRAEVLFGQGTVISTEDWIAARDS